ncbi:protein NUCLEAR FUSION DEFECTIVE 2-like isoform X3 [Sesbania bispinosa]|nr:protein NUCLEAR FUSION DEFECTIVE 2-like isoform X3 [Sesbania bispinosa]
MDLPFVDVSEAMKGNEEFRPKKQESPFNRNSKGKSLDLSTSSSKKRKGVCKPKTHPFDSVPDTPLKKQGTNRSTKTKKELTTPTRASERLKAKSVLRDLPPTSPSNPLVITDAGDGLKVARAARVSTPPFRAVTQGYSVGKGGEDEEGESFVSDHASTPSCDGKSKGCFVVLI